MNNKNLLISVVVPIYNGELYLDKCIQSIINQTYTDLEIILVDDGSTDNTYNIAKSYTLTDKRIKIIQKQNEGLALARKAGIENTTGDYITFVDADDFIDNNAYESIITELDECFPDIMAYGMVEEYGDKRIIKNNCFKCDIYNKEKLCKTIYPSMLSSGSFFNFGILPNLVCKFIKRTLFEKSNINVSSDVSFGEDADMTFQLLVNSDMLQISDKTPYHYIKRSDSMISKKVEYSSILNLQNDLKTAFKKSGYYDIMKRQLKDFIMFVTLLKYPEKILKEYFKIINIGNKIALYGAGGYGQAVYFEEKESVVLWVDKQYKKYRSLGKNVMPIEKLINNQDEYEIIFIAILNVDLCEKIKKQIEKMGIKKQVIYFIPDDYKRIMEK